MALTADRDVVASGRTEIIHGVLAAGDIYYKGGLAQIDKTTGLAKVSTDVAGERAIGAFKAGTRGINAIAGQECEIETGKLWIPLATGAQTDVDGFFHATDDEAIAAMAAQAGDPCGRCIDYKLWPNSTTDKRLLIDFRQAVPKAALT